ncbi:hypothetical protein ACFWXO_43760 [Kitasatospora sp. NPDC059088]|uniref:hypothetical protein n=1 Tax=Kitasatospora sp. NPDC059088 TaxID=3346722 RepID=UPI003696F9C7
MSDHLTDEGVARRMDEAAETATRGQRREAARLYSQLGTDIQAQFGRFDRRAVDAFEAMARVISED